MNIDLEVGKNLFMGYLGKAFSKVGYTKVQSVFQRGRLVSYKGIYLKTEKSTCPVTEVDKPKKKNQSSQFRPSAVDGKKLLRRRTR